jgi:hypothetical protein
MQDSLAWDGNTKQAVPSSDVGLCQRQPKALGQKSRTGTRSMEKLNRT